MFEPFFLIPGVPLKELLIPLTKIRVFSHLYLNSQTPTGHRPLSQRYVLLVFSSSVTFPLYSLCLCQCLYVCTCLSNSRAISNTEWSLIGPHDIRVILTDLSNYIPAYLYIKPLLHECLYPLHSAKGTNREGQKGEKNQ